MTRRLPRRGAGDAAADAPPAAGDAADAAFLAGGDLAATLAAGPRGQRSDWANR